MKEILTTFGKYSALVGVISFPPGDDTNIASEAVILLNAGLIHRVGPNRVYVRLARQLAQLGYLVLRFDLSGIGDSSVRTDKAPFEKSSIDDVQQAMDHLAQQHGIVRFVLMGHCAGAINSFRTASEDSRVVGAVIINPEGASEEWSDFDKKRKTARFYQNYYTRSTLTDSDRWKKLLTGHADYKSIFRNLVVNIVWNKISTLAFRFKKNIQKEDSGRNTDIASTKAIFDKLAASDIHLLFIFSEGSTGYLNIQTLYKTNLRNMGSNGKLKLEVVQRADHTFTLASMQKNLMFTITEWMRETFATSISQTLNVNG